MFKFLLGVAFGAAGYWAWQSFGRDLLGLGSDQDTYSTYSGSNSNYSSGASSYGSSAGSTSSPSTSGGSASPSSTGSSSSSQPPSSSSYRLSGFPNARAAASATSSTQ